MIASIGKPAQKTAKKYLSSSKVQNSVTKTSKLESKSSIKMGQSVSSSKPYEMTKSELAK